MCRVVSCRIVSCGAMCHVVACRVVAMYVHASCDVADALCPCEMPLFVAHHVSLALCVALGGT